jgi:hypothetical protein
MLIPSDTAKPLNSFLNSGLTLKLSESFSGVLLSLRLLAKAVPLWRDDHPAWSRESGNDTDFCLSCNPESRKSACPEGKKNRIMDRAIHPSIAHHRTPALAETTESGHCPGAPLPIANRPGVG